MREGSLMLIGILISAIVLASIFRIMNSTFLETIVIISVIYILGIHAYMKQFSAEEPLWAVAMLMGIFCAIIGAIIGFLFVENYLKIRNKRNGD